MRIIHWFLGLFRGEPAPEREQPATPPLAVPSATQLERVLGSDGSTYVKVREERKVGASMYEIELWERVDPPSPDLLWTPTLNSRMHPELPPVFVGVARRS